MAREKDRLTPLADTDKINMSRLFVARGDDVDLVGSFKPRIAAIIMAVGAAAIVLTARAADLAVLNSVPVETAIQASGGDPVARANIVDRNDVLLAANIETWNVYIWRADIDDVDRLVRRLSMLDSVPSAQVLKQRLSGNTGRARIARSVTPKQRREIFNLAEPGVEFESKIRRVYPNGSLASHFLGWVNADGFGVSGVEGAFDARLRDKNETLKLSLDSRVQFTLEDEMQKAIVLHKPLAAIGLVTHIPTGEVLALASWPDFDPNHFSTTTPDHRRNRALIDPYELGSVFKPLTMAMALESGMKMDEINIDVKQKLVIAGREIKDFHPGPSPMNATDILVHSSNKGAARLALRTGAKAQRKYLERFGLLAPAQIELRGSANAYMVSNNWSDIKTATIGFGHGLSVSPLSFVSALSGVVNGGLQVPITVLPADNDNLSTKYVVSPETSRLVRTAMRKVVIEGSGKRADVPGYGVAGKTGSAEKWDAKLSAYAKDRNVSSFVAVFPWESPQYMVFVLLDEPQGGVTTFGWETAGWNAAPAVHNIIERIGPLLDAPYSRPDQVAESELSAQVGE
ncbi:MAG: penicillin-binding protein 2 [Robiginitomaculum sp.]|nr:penicillin-binding protein 2 [Robiginitomaculum sp.]